MSLLNRPTNRATRYRNLLTEAASDHEFSLKSLKRCLREEHPSFVTRTVNALVRDGLLEPTSGAPKPSYRWALNRDADAIEAWIERKVHANQIKNGPIADRPRERLLANGPSSLRTAELLAILIRTGRPGESALQAGEKVAARFAECLERLATAGRSELRSLSAAIGETAFCQLMAGIELGRRVAEEAARIQRPTKITGSADAIAYCATRFERLAKDGVKEEFHILTLDTKNQVIGSHQISVGTLDASLIHPREVFRPAIQDAAATVILIHNHPSGNPSPSRQDIEVTEQLDKAGQTVGIKVLDHIVLGSASSVSIREVREAG